MGKVHKTENIQKKQLSFIQNKRRTVIIKIAILHHALGRFGGAEKMAILHSIYLRKLGFYVELFYNGPLHPDWKKRARSNIALNTLPFGFPPSFKGFRDVKKLMQRLKSFDVVLIHHHIGPFLAYYLTIFLKTKLVWYCGEPLRALWETQLSGIPSTELRSTVRPTSVECYGKSFTSLFLSDNLYNTSINLLRAIDKKTARGYKKIIANSNYTKKVIKALYDLNQQITVAYPGIEIQQQTPNDENHILNNYILAIGAMIPMKNHINLLKAYRQLPPEHRSTVKLVIIGKGPLKEEIQSIAHELGLNNIIFQSHVQEQELTSYYKNCKFIVHLALHEPFGLVPIEAALFGKPSIVSNQGGTKEFIRHGENGFLVNPYDPNDVAKNMQCLIENEQLAAEMGLKAREAALKEFTIEKSTKAIVEALKPDASLNAIAGVDNRKITFITDPLLTTVGSTRPPFLLATELQKNGYDVTLVSLSVSEEVRKAAKENNIQVKSLGSNFNLIHSFPILEAWAKSLLKSRNSFHLEGLGDNGIVINASSCIKVKSHLYYGQGPITRALDDMLLEMPARYKYMYSLSAPLLRYLDKKTVRDFAYLSNSVIANSRFCASMYEDLDVKVDGVISPPLDRTLFKPTTSEPSQDYVLTYFGAYNKETKFAVIKQVADTGVDVKAFGYKASGIPTYISRHPNIQFLGAISNEELVNLYSNALYVLFTFSHEPFGYIPIESMACGTPVLTYNRQGPSESVENGVTGWLVDSDKELVNLASRVWKDGYPQEMRKNSITRASLFDSKKIAEKWIKLFREQQ
ncbi:MAG: glycosyltransferase family 4 protein [Candidatus Bathyarchaeum sp.]|nr:MAG: glycosyltransferase family 4 protein [Candidatus Bathyarchaeum sp.]